VLICTSCGHGNGEGAKFCEECGLSLSSVAASPGTQEQRKTVTVLFCDLTGSTELGESMDPERLRVLLARYFERMQVIVERHGGSVEKFIGDAVMAVFGVPVLHEDDALRAVRAAVEMRDALPELGLRGRIGVMTGEVVTGTEERLATGDAVNVAARLEQAAEPGEVLVGGPTLALVGEVVEVEPVEPLELKGKTDPVPAYRLLHVRDAPERRHGESFVGRTHEFALLREAWERVRNEQRCELVTIVGDAGVGKSRLAVELLASIEATIARGHCLPYGEGITYWPVVEVLKQLALLPPDEVAAAAVRSLLGEAEGQTSPDEIAWAFRKTLEYAAAQRPLVVVFDDIQWGEETFLDLVEHVALLSAGAPILLVCMARPELTEHRSDWPVSLQLDGLREEDIDALLPAGMRDELRRRIARAAGGNPLFVEEMLAVVADADGEMVVPPTLRALLGARLDQLDVAERRVLERAAVEGEVFHRGAVQALSPADAAVTPRLAALVRRQLIRPERPQLVGEDGFRFRHLLIRDAAYDSLPKAARADLHLRFATWVRQRWAALIELDEIVGYHLEQALRYQAELGLPRDEAVAAAVVRHLSAAGRRADARGDSGAAAKLLARAAAALPADQIDLAIETNLIEALVWAGRGDEALRRAESLVSRAGAIGDHIAELCGRITTGYVRLWVEPGGIAGHLEELIERALPVFQAAADRVALDVAYFTLAWVKQLRGRIEEGLEAVERAAEYRPERAGDLLAWRGGARLEGPRPVAELLAWLDEPDQREAQEPWLDSYRAHGLAMLGHIDEGRELIAETRAACADRGSRFEVAVFTGQQAAEIELLAGDPAAAAELATEGCKQLETLGDHYFRWPIVARLTQILCILDRLDAADELVERTQQLAASDEKQAQHRWRGAKAVVLARRGRQAEAEELARQAVAIAETTDFLNDQADAYANLAEVLQLNGKADEAKAALEQALQRYERKGNLVMARRTRDRLAAAVA
jgi:class 3 adenylate cyclase/tetratricopeptide (TPR) repeat protein